MSLLLYYLLILTVKRLCQTIFVIKKYQEAITMIKIEIIPILISEIKVEFKRGNYEKVISTAEELLDCQLTDNQELEVRLYLGKSLLKTDKHQRGFDILNNIVDHPEIKNKSEILLLIEDILLDGTFYTEENNKIYEEEIPYVKRFEYSKIYFDKLIDFYEKTCDKKHLIKRYFKLADFYDEKISYYIDEEDSENEKKEQKFQMEKICYCYDRIIELSVKNAYKANATYKKAKLLMDVPPTTESYQNLAVQFFHDILKNYKGTPSYFRTLEELAFLYEEQGDYKKALLYYRALFTFSEKADVRLDAKERYKKIVEPVLELGCRRIFIPETEKPKLDWGIRNLKTVTFSIYRIDLFKFAEYNFYDSKLPDMEHHSGKPIETFTVETKDEGLHKFYKSYNVIKYFNAFSIFPKSHKHFRDAEPSEKEIKEIKELGEEFHPQITLPIHESGVYLVKGVGNNGRNVEVTAYTLVFISKLGMLIKTGNRRGFAFLSDSMTGKPVLESELNYLYFDNDFKKIGRKKKRKSKYFTKLKNKTFSFMKYFDKTIGYISIAAKFEQNYALINDLNFNFTFMTELKYYLYTFLDKSIYRPGETVNFKIFARLKKNNLFSNAPHKRVVVKLMSPGRERVFGYPWEEVDSKAYHTDDIGSISGSFILSESCVLGRYIIKPVIYDEDYYGEDNSEKYYDDSLKDYRYDIASSDSAFRVEEYKKPEYKVEVSFDKSKPRLGDKLKVFIDSKYYFGKPVTDAKVSYTVNKLKYAHFIIPKRKYDWYYDYKYIAKRWRYSYPSYSRHNDIELESEGTTDQNGRLTFEIETSSFDDSPEIGVKYYVEAEVTDQSRRQIKGSGTINVTATPFSLFLEPERYLTKPDSDIFIYIRAEDVNNRPVSVEGTIKIYPVRYEKTDSKEKQSDEADNSPTEVLGDAVLTDSISVNSLGETSYRWNYPEEDYYKVVVTASGDSDEEIDSHCYLWICEKKDHFENYEYPDIEIITDKDTYEMGEKAKLLINTKHKGSTILLTAEADDIYSVRLIEATTNSILLDYPIKRSFEPNIYLCVSLFHDNRFFEDKIEIVVPPSRKFLNVKIRSPKEVYGPSEETEFTIITTDKSHKLCSAVVSIAFIDESVYYIQDEYRDKIQEFFYGNKRDLNIKSKSNLYSGNYYNNWADYYDFFHSIILYKPVKLAYDLKDDERAIIDEKTKNRQENDGIYAHMSEADDGVKQGDIDLKKAVVRKDFRDAMFWSPDIRTGIDGTAKVKVKFPDALTSWRMTMVAITKDSKVGELVQNFVTTKNLLVRLQSPRFFLEGDIVYVSANIHNYLQHDKICSFIFKTTTELDIQHVLIDGKEADVSIERHDDNVEVASVNPVKVDRDNQLRIDFVVFVKKPGTAGITFEAQTDEESDAVFMEFPVLEYGIKQIKTLNAVLDTERGETEKLFYVNVPEQIRKDTLSMKMTASPSIINILVQTLPFLIDYPYGCVEQTLSRFIPAVIVRNTLDKLGISLETLNDDNDYQRKTYGNMIYDSDELEKIIDKGLNMLFDAQKYNGSWGWWKDSGTDLYMTTYAVYGLNQAVKNGIRNAKLDMLKKGENFLLRKLEENSDVDFEKKRKLSEMTYLLYVLSECNSEYYNNKALRSKLDEIYLSRDKLNEYSMALFSLTYSNFGHFDKANSIINELEKFVQIDDTNNLAFVKRESSKYAYWYQNPLESTTFVLQSYLAADKKHKLVPMMAEWILQQRKDNKWYSTKDSAFCIYTLIKYLEKENELNPALNVRLKYGTTFEKKFTFDGSSLLTADKTICVSQQHLKTGRTGLNVSIDGKGKLYLNHQLSYFTREKDIKESGSGINLQRKYYKLIKHVVTKERRAYDIDKVRMESYNAIEYENKPLSNGETLNVGDEIEVRLIFETSRRLEYLIIEDPKPSGCEPLQLVSGRSYQNGFCSNLELRDEKTVFFADYIQKGNHCLRYRLRCEIPGTYNVLPSQANAMYSQNVNANSSSFKLSIKDIN